MKKHSENWLVKNWQIVLLITLALFVTVYDALASFTTLIGNPISLDLKVNLLLILVSGFVIDMLIEFRQMKEIQTEQTGRHRRAFFPFVDEVYEQIDSLENGIQSEKLELRNRYDSMATLLRMIDTAQISYDGINYYLGGWKTGMKDFFQANVSAVHRGVKVRRYFILREEHKERNLIEQLITEMKTQASQGIEVHFILESDLSKIPYFRHNPIRGIGLYDNKILSYDTSPAKDADAPVEITITWNSSEVEKRNPFPYLMNSGLLKSYPKHSNKLTEWIEGFDER